jgi:hypothetical protein
MTGDDAAGRVRDVSVPLDRDVFLRSLIGALSGALEEVVGLAEASGDSRAFRAVPGPRR